MPEGLAVGVGGAAVSTSEGCLGGGSSEHLQRLPQGGGGAPQGGLLRPRTHLNSVKQWVPICSIMHAYRQTSETYPLCQL